MFGLNTYMLIAFAVAASIMLGYFSYSQYEMKKLNQLVEAQKTDILAQDALITQLEKDAKDIKEANQKLSNIIQTQNTQSQSLEEKLNKLKGTSPQKAAALERLINIASAQRIRCIAIATGAVVKDGEINGVCPQFMPKKVVKKK